MWPSQGFYGVKSFWMLSRVLCATWLVALAGILTAQMRPSDAYATPNSCAVCHAKISENYAKTGMGRSFFAPSTVNSVEDYGNSAAYYHQPSDTYFSMSLRGGKY